MRGETRLRLREIVGISTFRLSIALGGVFVTGLIVMLGVVYIVLARDMTARSDHILHAAARRLVTVPAEDLPDRIRAELNRDQSGFNYLALVAQDGSVVIGNLHDGRTPPVSRVTDVEATSEHGPLRLLAIRTRRGETLVVGRDITLLRDLRHTLFETLVVSGLLTLLCIAAVAIPFGRAPLRRVRALQSASREIATGNFAVRMPIAGRHDELDQFAATMNATVEEIGRVVAQVKGVTDAIAHDLRTPLTRVRTTLHGLRRGAGDPQAVTAGLDRAAADLDLVLERFAALLRISELEASQRRAGFQMVDLALLAQRVCDLYEPLAEDRDVALVATSQPLRIEGDEKLLFEALSNLVDNAIKFTPPGGTVQMAVFEDGGAPAIEVRDNGPGIAPDQREAVLRRFHRGADAQGLPGSGLGLSVVVAILHLHGFTLRLGDAGPGLAARIVMARASGQ